MSHNHTHAERLGRAAGRACHCGRRDRRRGRLLDAREAFVKAVDDLYLNRNWPRNSFDFAAHTASIRAIPAAIKGKTP